MRLFLSARSCSFRNTVYPCDLRQMDTEQLPNHWEHPSHILDIRETHSVWRDPSERNCNSRRLQRCQLIKSISFWPFYSQKGDWHPSGMAPAHHVPILWLLFPWPVHLLLSYGDYTNPTPIAVRIISSPICHAWRHLQKASHICAQWFAKPYHYSSVLQGTLWGRQEFVFLFDTWGSRDLKNKRTHGLLHMSQL